MNTTETTPTMTTGDGDGRQRRCGPTWGASGEMKSRRYDAQPDDAEDDVDIDINIDIDVDVAPDACRRK
ncbi:hypothetical protein ACHAW5_011347 [Stephanodiscus triporus]|uniref:Uncharacterized protein n=1 Tax=Stephanodiscus triporus TaxID=2934178 RepID=A0ABD3QQR3_9STRA